MKRHPQHTLRRTHTAFTLVEVLVAVAIFVVFVGAFSQALVASFNAVSAINELQNYDTDLRLVRRTVLQIKERDDVEDGGEVETIGSGEAKWEAEIETVEVIDLFKLTLTIEFEDDPDEAVHEMVLYVLRPDWSDEAEHQALREDRLQAIRNERERR